MISILFIIKQLKDLSKTLSSTNKKGEMNYAKLGFNFLCI